MVSTYQKQNSVIVLQHTPHGLSLHMVIKSCSMWYCVPQQMEGKCQTVGGHDLMWFGTKVLSDCMMK